MPGIFIEVLLEAAFSPQGFHDGQSFAWIVSLNATDDSSFESLGFQNELVLV
jgi:hypothetical protein